jgi:hypothetical protein
MSIETYAYVILDITCRGPFCFSSEEQRDSLSRWATEGTGILQPLLGS